MQENKKMKSSMKKSIILTLLFLFSIFCVEYFELNSNKNNAIAQTCSTIGLGTCRWENFPSGCSNDTTYTRNCNPGEYINGMRYTQGDNDVKCHGARIQCCNYF